MKKTIAKVILRTCAWKLDRELQLEPPFVLIAAPHTSNWDFPLMILFAASCELKVSWFAKDSLFKPYMGWFMRALGGVPVQRGNPQNLVADMTRIFSEHRDFVLVLPVEATRSLTDYWKSGFYHIAQSASVPIVPAYLDYQRKCGGFGKELVLSGNVNIDMDYFRAFYADKAGKFPEQFGPVRLKEELSEEHKKELQQKKVEY